MGPAAPYPIRSVDCADGKCGTGWSKTNDVGWQYYAQGEYVGHQRIQHVPEYRLRVDDKIDLIFRVTRDETSRPYQLNVGDEIRVESFTDQGLNRDLIIQPDGTITLRLLGQIRATRHTVTQLRDEIEDLYKQYYKVPAITVTPLKVNAKLEDLRATVDSRFGFGGQARQARVTPEGTIALPAIGNVMAQGLTLGELKRELDERYAQEVEGLEITPVLFERVASFYLCLGPSASSGALRSAGSHDRNASDQPGRELASRQQSAAGRSLPPRRRLAPDGHDARSARGDLRQDFLPVGRNLVERLRHRGRSAVTDSGRRQFY